MLISDKHKLIFYHIPKAAGTTVSRDLECKLSDSKKFWGRDKGFDLAHLTYRESEQFLKPKQINDYLKICVIRNPYNRFISAFNDRKYELFLANRINSLDLSIDSFLESILINVDLFSDLDFVHFKPAFEFAVSCDQIMLDRLIPFESFHTEYTKLLQTLGVDKNYNSLNMQSVKYRWGLKRRNIVLTNPNVSKTFYELKKTTRIKEIEESEAFLSLSAKSVEILNQIYAKDFEYFDYVKL